MTTPPAPLEGQARCPACQRLYTLPFGPRPNDGRTIQVQFPKATPTQREMYLTGLCSDACWNKYLGIPEEPCGHDEGAFS